MKSHLRVLLGLLLAAVLLMGCGGDAAEESAEQAPAEGSAAGAEFSLTGVSWQWRSMTVQGGETTTVDSPAGYTVNFAEDGTVFGAADCNNFAGTYTTEQGGIQITLGPSTLAFCGEESLDTLFLESLGQVVAGGPVGDGTLALENGGGARRMIFADGGPSPQP